MKIVFDWPKVTAWVADHAELERSTVDMRSIGVLDGDTVRGGAVYTDYTGPGGSVHIHLGGRWTAPPRDFIWALFDYPFNQLGVETLIGVISEQNERVLSIALRVGFCPEGRILRALPGGIDQLILTARRDTCMWLKHKPRAVRSRGDDHGGRQSTAAA